MFFSNTTTSTDDRNENSLGANQDDEFCQRLLSRESSGGGGGTELSFRLYYGVTPVAIPFDWESQPGKPKREDVVPAKTIINPPLTPPPSYRSQTCSSAKTNNGVEKVSNSRSFFLTVLRGLRLNKKTKSEKERVRSLSTSPFTPSDSSSSLSSSTSSSMLSPMIRPRHRRSYSTSCLKLGHKGSKEESAVSDSCFWKKGR